MPIDLKPSFQNYPKPSHIRDSRTAKMYARAQGPRKWTWHGSCLRPAIVQKVSHSSDNLLPFALFSNVESTKSLRNSSVYRGTLSAMDNRRRYRKMRLRRYVACKLCGGTLMLPGQLGRLAWYRCRHCGIEVSREFGTKRRTSYTFWTIAGGIETKRRTS